MTCDRTDIYANVEHCVGQTNMPGTQDFLYYIRRADIVAWPARKGGSLAGIVTIEGNFTLAEGKYWKKLTLTADANSIVCESQGAEGSKTFNNQVNAVHPGIAEEAAGLCAELNNDDVIFLVPIRRKEHPFRLFGSELFKATINPKQESGAAVASDSAQTTLEIAVTDDIPAPFYQGEILVGANEDAQPGA